MVSTPSVASSGPHIFEAVPPPPAGSSTSNDGLMTVPSTTVLPGVEGMSLVPTMHMVESEDTQGPVSPHTFGEQIEQAMEREGVMSELDNAFETTNDGLSAKERKALKKRRRTDAEILSVGYCGFMTWKKIWDEIKGGFLEHPFVQVFRFMPLTSMTRCRRAMMIFLSVVNFMFFSAMFFNPSCSDDPNPMSDCKEYTFWEDLVVGFIVGTAVGMPVRFFAMLIKNTRCSRKHPFSTFQAMLDPSSPTFDKRLARQYKLQGLRCCSCFGCGSFMFPYWTIAIWFLIAFAEIGAASYMCILYGFYFSQIRMEAWLMATGTSTIQDNFMQEPVVILITAILTVFLTTFINVASANARISESPSEETR